MSHSNEPTVLPPGRSSLAQAGGSLGIAGVVIGFAIMLTACAGFGAAVKFSFLPLALGCVGMILTIAGAALKRTTVDLDTHVLASIFLNLFCIMGGLLEMAAWRHWEVFVP